MPPCAIPNSAWVSLRRARMLRSAHRAVSSSDAFVLSQIGGKRRAFVERHHDIRAEPLLDFHRAFRREHQRRAVEMRTEADAVFVDGVYFREAHRLKAARIRQHRAAKAHELRDAAHLIDQLLTRPNREMVRVGQNQPIAHVPQLIGRHRLDRGAACLPA